VAEKRWRVVRQRVQLWCSAKPGEGGLQRGEQAQRTNLKGGCLLHGYFLGPVEGFD